MTDLEFIVCCSLSQWGDIPHNSRHLMRVAHDRGARVLYVESVGLRSTGLSGRDLRKIARRLRRMVLPLRRVAPGFWVLSPVAVPLQGTAWAERLNRTLLSVQLRTVCRLLRFRRPTLWTYLPQCAALGDAIGASNVIYFRTDDYTAIPGVHVESMRAAECDAVSRADLCIAPARRYLTEALRDARRKLWLPNAVDISHYGQPVGRRQAAGGPVLLMVGTIESWVAVDLLEQVLEARPEWSLLIAGPVKTSVGELFSHTNVRYLGVVPYTALPALMAGADVGLIPFRRGAVSEGATPGKLFQYLAAGLPVVATNFITDDEIRPFVYAAPESPEGFAGVVAAAVSDNSDEQRVARRGFAESNTWEARFSAVESALGSPA